MLPRPEHVFLPVPSARCMLLRRAQAFTQLPKNPCWGWESWVSIVFHWSCYLHNWCEYHGKIMQRCGWGLFKVDFWKNTGIHNAVLWIAKPAAETWTRGYLVTCHITCPPYKGITHPWRGCSTCVLSDIPECSYFSWVLLSYRGSSWRACFLIVFWSYF